MLEGKYDCKFADIALRLGDLHREGFGLPKNQLAALYFFLQARYAIRMRRKTAEQYGDDIVEKNIERAIRMVLPDAEQAKRPAVLADRTPELIVSLIPLRQDDYYEMRLRKMAGGRFSVTICRADSPPYTTHHPYTKYKHGIRERNGTRLTNPNYPLLPAAVTFFKPF